MGAIKAAVAAGIGAAVAASLVGAGTANAATGSEQAYLNTLRSNGFYVYAADWAISSGWQTCADVEEVGGNAAAVRVFRNSSWEDVANLHIAAQLVNISADTLCPWVWNNPTERNIF